MGCGFSSSIPPVASRAAWQSFFCLDGLPLSLTVEQVQTNLHLRIVGLDCAEELPLLERAIAKRDFVIKTATLIKIGSHIDQTFELQPLYHAPVRAYLMRRSKEISEIEVTSVSASELKEMMPQAATALQPASGKKMEQIVKLSVDCPARGGERGVVIKMMRSLKYKLICATLKTDTVGLADTFYITPDPELNGYPKAEDLLLAEFRLAVFDVLQNNCSTMSAVSKVSSTTPKTPGTTLNHMENQAAQSAVQLPIALRDLQKTLVYQLHGPVNSGLVIDGFWKYVGIGLAQRSLEEMLGFKEKKDAVRPLVLEIRTCFVSEHAAKSSGQFAEFSHLLHDAIVGTEEFANFVSWLDISKRTWTIDRVYLNGILPPGHGYGAKAIAEHLVASPLLFFQSDSSAQIGSFLNSMPDLEKVVISDIVNWNTYLLMAVAGTSEAESSAKVGDVLGFALNTELSAAGLTKHTLYNGSILEVFQRTVLGKMVFSALKIWNEKLNRGVNVTSAEVVYGEGDEEIFGQRRPRMAVILRLEQPRDRVSSSSPIKGLEEVRRLEEVQSDIHAALEGMGQFLEGVRGKSHSKVYAPLASARHYFASLSSAMTCLLHQLQVERSLSCRATAADPSVLATAVDRLQNQRAGSDKAFAQLVEILRLAPILMEQGVIQDRHKKLFALNQEIPVETALQRAVVNDAMQRQIPTWMGRFEVVCATAGTGYNFITEKLLRGIRQAIDFASEELSLLTETKERCEVLLQWKEHVSRERGMLAAKGQCRMLADDVNKKLFDDTTASTEIQLALIEKDSSLSQTTENPMLIDALTEMHASYKKEIEEKDFTFPAEKAVQWFETLTRWIFLVYDYLQAEIEALSEALPDNNLVHLTPDLDLRVQVEEPGLSEEPLQQLLMDVQAGLFQKVVVMAGAGISVSANLPDFRSKGGLYDQLRQSTKISSPETIFTQEFLRSDPQLFFEVMQKLQADHVSPTLTHQFIKKLQDKNLLQRCYTQNIDGLERKVGIKEDLLVECHGTMTRAKCDKCKEFYKKEDYFASDKPPLCSFCGGQIRPDIVLFGEPLPEGFQTLPKTDFETADLLIVMGTSLRVQPFANLPRLIKPSCALLVINREFPQSLHRHRTVRALGHSVTEFAGGQVFSQEKLRKHVFLAGECDTSVRWFMEELGWIFKRTISP